ncbi:DUF3747 domain-containing protein [Pantanalinema rosaneae CENA516]|uniref:DUF3747 domain-containing protein n=1 Tax=Pantanalinema rosaneae TaxID=1620701 RepID=UPI003D6DBCB3
MNTSSRVTVAALATLTAASFGNVSPASAAGMFGQQEVDQNKFALIASPYSNGTAHQLLIVEQISNARPCWSESPAGSVTAINPLLTEFDFTNICGRSIDSNGYSLRAAGEDQNWKYSLRVAKRDNDILLLGTPTSDRSAPELLIGRVRGNTNGFAKIHLEPGWRLTKRVYNGSALGHIYLTNDQTIASLNASALAVRPPITTPTLPTTPVKPPTPTPTQPTNPPVVTQPVTPSPVTGKPITQPPTVPPVSSKPVTQPPTVPPVSSNPVTQPPTATNPTQPQAEAKKYPWWQFWNWGKQQVQPTSTQTAAPRVLSPVVVPTVPVNN